jgi:hypothetical protein
MPEPDAPLTLTQLEAWLRASDELLAIALRAKQHGEQALADGLPVSAREWFEAAAAAMRARDLFNAGGER